MWFRSLKTQEIYPKKLKVCFYTVNLPPSRGTFWSCKIKLMYLGYGGMLLQHFGFCSKFSIGDIPINLIGYSIRIHCTCDYSVEEISSTMSPWYWWNICHFYVGKNTEKKPNNTEKPQEIWSFSERGISVGAFTYFLESTYEFFSQFSSN